MPKTDNLTFQNYFSFGLGDFAFNLFFQAATLFLLFFYTDVLGIDAQQFYNRVLSDPGICFEPVVQP